MTPGPPIHPVTSWSRIDHIPYEEPFHDPVAEP